MPPFSLARVSLLSQCLHLPPRFCPHSLGPMMTSSLNQYLALSQVLTQYITATTLTRKNTENTEQHWCIVTPYPVYILLRSTVSDLSKNLSHQTLLDSALFFRSIKSPSVSCYKSIEAIPWSHQFAVFPAAPFFFFFALKVSLPTSVVVVAYLT